MSKKPYSNSVSEVPVGDAAVRMAATAPRTLLSCANRFFLSDDTSNMDKVEVACLLLQNLKSVERVHVWVALGNMVRLGDTVDRKIFDVANRQVSGGVKSFESGAVKDFLNDLRIYGTSDSDIFDIDISHRDELSLYIEISECALRVPLEEMKDFFQILWTCSDHEHHLIRESVLFAIARICTRPEFEDSDLRPVKSDKDDLLLKLSDDVSPYVRQAIDTTKFLADF